MRHLVNQSRERKLRRAGQWLRLGMQVFLIVIIGVVGAVLIVMLADAINSRSVVLELFNAPPALASRGLSGNVVAAKVLDALTRLQAATRANAAQRNLTNAWTGDIKADVPETGISISDMVRMLKKQFGNDIEIGGDLVQTGSGDLALTVRGDGVLPKTFEGGAGDLDKLTTEAAEYVYGQAEPALYGAYLATAGRSAEALAFAQAAFTTARLADKPYILNEWGNAIGNSGGSAQEALAIYRQALALKPDYWTAYNNIMNAEWDMGNEEGVWRTGEAMRAVAGGRPGPAPESDYQNLDILDGNLQAMRAALLADQAAYSGIGSGTSDDGPIIADIDAKLHDPQDAEMQLRTGQTGTGDPTIAAIGHFVRGQTALDAGDVQRAATEMEAFGVAYANPVVSTNYPSYDCWIAPAEEAAGHPDKADAALKAGGHFVDCFRFRGDILDHRGNWAGAQKAYAASVALAPDLPAGYYSWGLALARHGDLAGAAAALAAAHSHGPNWADPLKAWGDVLARQGRWAEALTKYDEALKDAPAWAALHQAHDVAARHNG